MNWQPIETAPKDGTILRVRIITETGMAKRGVGAWDSRCECWSTNLDVAPSEWMPPPDQAEIDEARERWELAERDRRERLAAEKREREMEQRRDEKQQPDAQDSYSRSIARAPSTIAPSSGPMSWIYSLNAARHGVTRCKRRVPLDYEHWHRGLFLRGPADTHLQADKREGWQPHRSSR